MKYHSPGRTAVAPAAQTDDDKTDTMIGEYTLHPNCMYVINPLRPRQMDAISQTTFSKAFPWIKMLEFRLKCHWRLFLRVQLTIFHHWFRKWLGAVKATSHYLNQWWLVCWRIYASLGLNVLMLAVFLSFGTGRFTNMFKGYFGIMTIMRLYEYEYRNPKIDKHFTCMHQ